MKHLADRVNMALERWLPEQRLFLRSDTETRFIRLRPLTQAIGLGGGALVVGWTIIATSILLMDSIGSGNLRDQAQREQLVYETRLNEMATERDQRTAEAVAAQERFSVAMQRVSEMQSALLASEEQRVELETGIDALHDTLRRTVRERDAARERAAELTMALASETGSERTEAGRARDVEDTLEFLIGALASAADERDQLQAIAFEAGQQAEFLAMENRLIRDRNNRIFTQLEEAVSISMEPLERMFRAAGLPPEQILEQVRSGYQMRSAALTPIAISTQGTLDPDSDEMRANTILAGLEEINLYRVAAERAPFAQPIRTNVRFTSGFGPRRDPRTGQTRQHNGVDWAGPQGTAIHATADGVVIHAGWQGGYGRLVKIRHDFGVETYYAHLHRIDVTVGQRVSRGDRIGGMGTTGRSTGVHLHYEVRVGGRPVNPMNYIRAASDVF